MKWEYMRVGMYNAATASDMNMVKEVRNKVYIVHTNLSNQRDMGIVIEVLDKFGAEGWEVAAYDGNGLILKRPLNP